jgi:hypothetical protein
MGVGRALTLSCLHAMRGYGYGYAVIGSVGPAAFYEKCLRRPDHRGLSPAFTWEMLRESPRD